MADQHSANVAGSQGAENTQMASSSSAGSNCQNEECSERCNDQPSARTQGNEGGDTGLGTSIIRVDVANVERTDAISLAATHVDKSHVSKNLPSTSDSAECNGASFAQSKQETVSAHSQRESSSAEEDGASEPMDAISGSGTQDGCESHAKARGSTPAEELDEAAKTMKSEENKALNENVISCSDDSTDKPCNLEEMDQSADPMFGFSFQPFEEDGTTMHKLRDKEGNPYVFHISEDHKTNQLRYEKLCDGVTDYVYTRMERDCQLNKVYIPVEHGEGDPRSFFFVSADAFTTTDRLLILIHGSGSVRAGQWSRRIIINDNLESGSQLPYIKMGRERGYEIMVLNTNLNVYPDDKEKYYSKKKREFIRGSENPEEHACYVWTNFIQKKTKAKHIAIVAHSYGGVVTVDLACQIPEFTRRIFAVALTDSVHSMEMLRRTDQEHSEKIQRFYKEHVKNWVSSHLPLDTPVNGYSDDAPLVSAGTRSHEWTSDKAKESVFKFLEEQYALHLTAPQCDTPSSPSKSSSNCCTL